MITIEQLKEVMRENGIVGAGGAGFPSYAKLDKSVDTIILNCAECEPLLRLHRQLLETQAHKILSALDLISKTLGVKNVFIALKKAYKDAIKAVEAELDSFENIKISTLDEVYPAGDEIILIYEVTGRVVNPGALPLSVGVNVFNVETIYNVYRAVYEDTPVVEKYITITGEVKNPQTFIVPVGTKLSTLIELAGGETVNDAEYVMGGPMMGPLGSIQDYVTKTSNAVIVLPADHYVVMRKKSNSNIGIKRAMASCSQCHYCSDLCPRHMLGHPIEPHKFMRAVSNHDTRDVKPYLDAMFCSSCGLCEMYSCHQGLSPRSLIADFKAEMRKNGIAAPKGVEAKPISEFRDLKRVPIERLTSRMGLTKYDGTAPISDLEIKPDTVRIMLSQHIGAPAVAVVAKGDKVSRGQIIGKVPDDKLGTHVHASIDGKVAEVTDKYIIIKA